MKKNDLHATVRLAIMSALERSPVDSLFHLKDVCETGGIIGRRHCSCFYGTLAFGAHVISKRDDNITLFEKLQNFSKVVLNVELIYGHLDAVEKFCMSVQHNMTARTSPEIALIYELCLGELRDRGRIPEITQPFHENELLRGIPLFDAAPDYLREGGLPTQLQLQG